MFHNLNIRIFFSRLNRNNEVISALSTVVPVSSPGYLSGSLTFMPFIDFSLLHRVRKLLGQM